MSARDSILLRVAVHIGRAKSSTLRTPERDAAMRAAICPPAIGDPALDFGPAAHREQQTARCAVNTGYTERRELLIRNGTMVYGERLCEAGGCDRKTEGDGKAWCPHHSIHPIAQINPAVPLDSDQCVLARDGVETVATIMRDMGERLRVDLCGMRMSVSIEGTVNAEGYRLVHRGGSVRLVVIPGGAK